MKMSLEEVYVFIKSIVINKLDDYGMVNDVVSQILYKFLKGYSVEDFETKNHLGKWVEKSVMSCYRDVVGHRPLSLNAKGNDEDIEWADFVMGDVNDTEENNVRLVLSRYLTQDELQLVIEIVVDRKGYSEIGKGLGVSAAAIYKRLKIIVDKVKTKGITIEELKSNQKRSGLCIGGYYG